MDTEIFFVTYRLEDVRLFRRSFVNGFLRLFITYPVGVMKRPQSWLIALWPGFRQNKLQNGLVAAPVSEDPSIEKKQTVRLVEMVCMVPHNFAVMENFFSINKTFVNPRFPASLQQRMSYFKTDRNIAEGKCLCIRNLIIVLLMFSRQDRLTSSPWFLPIVDPTLLFLELQSICTIQGNLARRLARHTAFQLAEIQKPFE
ncbi:hypothetical protein AVEN_116048-1 [Araneus ventricosus]|uniref:Uncharacterized protein n=1 Tax=Araneus ventricosus TaxID=182803 RepID=A0A4Y2KSL9_ARAVE|nr:hypothetical protein AVEN_116048-1 [Araneus ventricosus]